MSQVVVTHDHFDVQRSKTRLQEARIDKEEMFAHWRKSDVRPISGLLHKIAAPALLPLLVFWALLIAGTGLALAFVVYLMKFLGKMFRRRTA